MGSILKQGWLVGAVLDRTRQSKYSQETVLNSFFAARTGGKGRDNRDGKAFFVLNCSGLCKAIAGL
jgi:hypothetical protein